MPCPPPSYNKKDSEAAGSQLRLKDLEAQMNSKDAMLATALSEKRGLEATLSDLQEQLQEVLHRTANGYDDLFVNFSINVVTQK